MDRPQEIASPAGVEISTKLLDSTKEDSSSDSASFSKTSQNQQKTDESDCGFLDCPDVWSAQDTESALKLEAATALGLTLAAEANIGEDLTIPPDGSRFEAYTVPKHLGCAASVSNLLLSAVKDFDEKDFQINVDGLENTLRSQYDAQKLTDADIAMPGDVIIGKNSSRDRHTGVVGELENGVRMVYHNHSGVWKKEPLDIRFGSYDDLYLLRLPAEATQARTSRPSTQHTASSVQPERPHQQQTSASSELTKLRKTS